MIGSKTKIVWIAHEGIKSGANNALLNYVAGLQNDNYDVTVIMPSKGNMWGECEKLNVNVKLFYYYSAITVTNSNFIWIRKRFRNLVTFLQVFLYFLKSKPDIVITNSIVSTPLFALAATLLKIKRIWYIQEFGDKDHGIKFDWSYQFILRYINFLSDKVIVVANAIKEHVSPPINSSKISVILNRVSIPKIFWDTGPGEKKDPLRILHIAQIAPGKNQLEGIQALKILTERGIDATLEIAGMVLWDEYKLLLDNYIIENNLQERVFFSGYSNDPFKKISDANIIILTSRCEACALTIFETLRIGTPIIVSNTGGNTEIINDKETGLVYKYGTPHNLADKVMSLYLDPLFSNKISSNAYAYSLINYDTKKSIHQIKAVIQSIN